MRMEEFSRLMTMIIEFMKRPFTIWGYSFSFWGMIIFITFISIVFWFISEIFAEW